MKNNGNRGEGFVVALENYIEVYNADRRGFIYIQSKTVRIDFGNERVK